MRLLPRVGGWFSTLALGPVLQGHVQGVGLSRAGATCACSPWYLQPPDFCPFSGPLRTAVPIVSQFSKSHPRYRDQMTRKPGPPGGVPGRGSLTHAARRHGWQVGLLLSLLLCLPCSFCELRILCEPPEKGVLSVSCVLLLVFNLLWLFQNLGSSIFSNRGGLGREGWL